MGEAQNGPFQFSFHASLKIDFQGSRVTSDGGLVLVRELGERLGLGELIEQHLTDPRGRNTRLPLADLLRQSVYSRLAGYEDGNDAERLWQGPTFRRIGSEKIWNRGAALTSRWQSFETEMLAEESNFAGLARLNRELIGKAEALDSQYRVVLDMDSTEIPVYREQEQSGLPQTFGVNVCAFARRNFQGSEHSLTTCGRHHSGRDCPTRRLPGVLRDHVSVPEAGSLARTAQTSKVLMSAAARKGVVAKPEDWRWSSYNNFALDKETVARCPMQIDYVRLREGYRA